MLLYCDNFSGFFCCCNDQFLIKWFDGMDVDNLCLNSICCKLLCCFKRSCHAKTICNDSNILTLSKNDTFTHFKFIIRIIINHRHCQTTKSHINRSLILISSFDHSLCFNVICRRHNNHSRNNSHKCKIFAALMSCTIFTNRNSAMSCTDLNIKMRISYRVTNLLISTSCCKHGKCAGKRNLTGSCKSGCDSYHITFCDTAVDMAFRKFLFKHSGLSSCSKVSIQNNKILMFFSKFHQSRTIACSCSNFLYF